MRSSILLNLSCLVLAFFAVASPVLEGQESQTRLQNWAQWRGPLGTGEAPQATPPVRWSETENVKWKTPIDGLGHSSPIVWQDYVFVTTAIPVGEPFEDPHQGKKRPGAHDNLPVTQKQRFAIVAIDRQSGDIRWQKSSSPGESHPQALTEPDVNLSAHPALIVQSQDEFRFAIGRTSSVRGGQRRPTNEPQVDYGERNV